MFYYLPFLIYPVNWHSHIGGGSTISGFMVIVYFGPQIAQIYADFRVK
jgi:hypothetical protein